MGWSVYVIDNANGLGFELGERWASGFPVEALLTLDSIRDELRCRFVHWSPEALDKLARHTFSIVERAGFDVRIMEGQELPDGVKYIGGFWEIR